MDTQYVYDRNVHICMYISHTIKLDPKADFIYICLIWNCICDTIKGGPTKRLMLFPVWPFVWKILQLSVRLWNLHLFAMYIGHGLCEWMFSHFKINFIQSFSDRFYNFKFHNFPFTSSFHRFIVCIKANYFNLQFTFSLFFTAIVYVYTLCISCWILNSHIWLKPRLKIQIESPKPKTMIIIIKRTNNKWQKFELNERILCYHIMKLSVLFVHRHSMTKTLIVLNCATSAWIPSIDC